MTHCNEITAPANPATLTAAAQDALANYRHGAYTCWQYKGILDDVEALDELAAAGWVAKHDDPNTSRGAVWTLTVAGFSAI